MSYESVFNSDPDIAKIVNCHEFSALSQIRHLIVHRASRIDGDFLKIAAAMNPLIPQEPLNESLFRYYRYAAVDDPIKLDGSMVRRFVDGATVRCFDLLQAVDRWVRDACRTSTS